MSATALVSVVAQLRDVRNMRTGRWVRIVRAESAIADDVDLDMADDGRAALIGSQRVCCMVD